MGLGWIGLATSNDSLTHVVNNSRGGKKISTHRAADGKGSMGTSNLLQWDKREEVTLLFLSGYRIPVPVYEWVMVSGWCVGHSFVFMKSNVSKCYLDKTHRWSDDGQDNTVLLSFKVQLSTPVYICARSVTLFSVSLWRTKTSGNKINVYVISFVFTIAHTPVLHSYANQSHWARQQPAAQHKD